MSSDASGRPVSVLLVDDEEVIRELARTVLERAGLTVLDEAEDGIQALERYRAQTPPDTPLVVLLDNRMPGLTGLEVAEEMLGSFPSQIVVLFSAHLDPEVTKQATSLGVAACVPKNEVTKLPALLQELTAQR
jgi:CheY-like chemotaxis protein